MSYPRTGQVTDEYGVPVPGATIYVYTEDGALASITSDGTASITQPITTDQFGNYSYYVDIAAVYREDTWYGGKLRFREVVAIGLDGLYPLNRDGKYFAFDADGNPIASVGIGSDSNLRTDLAQTTGAALVGKTGGGSVQDALTPLGTVDYSATPLTSKFPIALNYTWAGEAANDSDYRGLLISTYFVGSNGGFQQNCAHYQCEVRNAGATTPLSFAQGCEAYVRIGLDTRATGGTITEGVVSAANVFAGHVANESVSSNIPTAIVFKAKDTDWNDVAGSNGTFSKNYGCYAGNLSHATKLLTEAAGYYCNNMTTPAAGVTVAAFLSDMASAGKWNILCRGSSPSAHFGAFRIGDTTVPVEKLEVAGNALVTGSIKSKGTAGIGYATGAGGTVTQATSKSTSVTLNTCSGSVTTTADALAAGAVVIFNVLNSNVAATDTVSLNIKSGQATQGTYRAWVDQITGGRFVVALENRSAGSLSEAITLNFNLIKGVTS